MVKGRPDGEVEEWVSCHQGECHEAREGKRGMAGGGFLERKRLTEGIRVLYDEPAGSRRIDLQDGIPRSGFFVAYVLRHWGLEEYEAMPNKRRSGLVPPKGIRKLLARYGFKSKDCIGNLTAFKNEVSKGNPVIVMIRTWKGNAMTGKWRERNLSNCGIRAC